MRPFKTSQSSSKEPTLKLNRQVSILGCPLGLGQRLRGVEDAPSDLRKIGLSSKIEELGWEVVDHGNITDTSVCLADGSQKQSDDEIDPSVVAGYRDKMPDAWNIKKNIPEVIQVGRFCKKIADSVSESAAQGNFVLNLGGDHSVAFGTVPGIMKVHPNACVVWVDAHSDINTPETTPSGNLHGMPVAGCLGLIKPGVLPGFEWLEPCLTPDRLVYIGLRDLDTGEKRYLREQGITVFTMTDIDRYGIGMVMDKALEKVNPYGLRPIHLSWDIDGCDPSIAPSTGTRVQGGLNYRESHYIAECLAETGMVCSMDMVEINTRLGDEKDVQKTLDLGVELILSALGKTIL